MPDNQSFQDRILNTAVKQIEKRTKERVDQRLNQGDNPNLVLGDLMKAINAQAGMIQQMPTPDEAVAQVQQTAQQTQMVDSGLRKGIVPSLLDAITGKGVGFGRPLMKEQPIGMAEARAQFGLEQGQREAYLRGTQDIIGSLLNLAGEQRQQKGEAREEIKFDEQFPLEQAKRITELEQMSPEFKEKQLRSELGVRQEFEKEQEERARDNEFRVKILRKPERSGADATKYNVQKQALQSLLTIEQFLDKPEIIERLNVPGDPVGQQLGAAINIFVNASLRDESGGVITPAEIKSFKNDLSPGTGLRAVLTDPSAQRLRLNSFKERLQGSIRDMDPYVDVRNEYKEAIKYYPEKEVIKFLREKGIS